MNYQFQETEERAQRIAYLISGFINRTLTTREHDELDLWVEESDDNVELFAQLTDERNINEALAFMKSLDKDKAYKKVRSRIAPQNRKRRWILPAAVAAILLIALGIVWLIRSNTVVTDAPPNDIASTTDIQPGSAKAVLQLANGKTLELGKESRGTIAKEGGIAINASEQTLTYTGNEPSATAAYNTLSIPKGGKYKLVLSDGTQVWINAASSIKYPAVFNDVERRVVVEGEAFFDVAKDEKKPFIVQVNNATIQVLGTSFNVSTYSDEPAQTAVLVSGKIKVVAAKKQQELEPGQQANIETTGNITVTPAIVQAATAWKEDRFVFKEESIESIMRQLARWYDVKVVYNGNINYHFSAKISRDQPISTILRLLEETKRVRFTLHPDTIEVSPIN
jgi:ferric-dicitrate binding protein FerR (iron transport regulator)